MKIEKLTENKIRIIVHADDLPNNQIDVTALFASNTPEAEGLFFKMLEMAEK